MGLDHILLGAFLAFSALFAAVFLLQRLQYRRKKAANPNYRGFYPTMAALGLTLLHTLAQPDLHHVLEQRQTEAEVEDEDGDPDDPAAQLNRQLKRIRNREHIDALRVPLKSRN